MAETIRILDLANPQMPQSFIDMSAAAEPLADAVVFEADAVIEQASRETGLTDFGEPGWQERLDVTLRGLREDAELSPMGKLSSFAQLVSVLKNRLLLEDLWKRHPEIDEVEQKPPIIIAGLPRSGTTHLHSLIGADPKFAPCPGGRRSNLCLRKAKGPLPANPTRVSPGPPPASNFVTARCPTSMRCTR